MTRLSTLQSTSAKREILRSLDDSNVVSNFLNGDELAFEELVDRYQVRLLNFIYRTIGDRDRAEDLLQETFMRVHRNIERFDRSKKFSTWIYVIASNLAKNELRNRARCPVVLFNVLEGKIDGDELQFEDPKYRPKDMLQKRHLSEIVEQAVWLLPIHHNEVFVLRDIEGKTYEEMAEITGLTLGTVKSRLNRARIAFAEIVSPLLPDR